MGIQLRVWVNPSAAIMAGKAVIRDQLVELDEAFVSSLSEEARRELVNTVADEEHNVIGRGFKLPNGTSKMDQPMNAPTLEQVKMVLEWRAKYRNEFLDRVRIEREQADAELRAAADTLHSMPIEELIDRDLADYPIMGQALHAQLSNPYCADLVERVNGEVAKQRDVIYTRKKEEKESARRAEEKKAVQRKQAIHTWVKEHGTDSQKERFKEGVLPEDEVLKDIREDLFGDLASFDRYTRLKAEDVCECDCVENVDFLTDSLVELSADEFHTFTLIRDNAPDGAKVEPKRHRGSCPNCDCAQVTRITALVTVEWHGFTLSREYALGVGPSYR